MQERSCQHWIKLRDRKSRAGNVGLRSKRGHKFLNTRRLSAGQCTPQQNRISTTQQWGERCGNSRRLFSALTNDAKNIHVLRIWTPLWSAVPRQPSGKHTKAPTSWRSTRTHPIGYGCFQFGSRRVFFRLGASNTFASNPETYGLTSEYDDAK